MFDLLQLRFDAAVEFPLRGQKHRATRADKGIGHDFNPLGRIAPQMTGYHLEISRIDAQAVNLETLEFVQAGPDNRQYGLRVNIQSGNFLANRKSNKVFTKLN
jgi:hypothetical protein